MGNIAGDPADAGPANSPSSLEDMMTPPGPETPDTSAAETNPSLPPGTENPENPPQITTSTNEAGDTVTDFGNGMQTIRAEDGTTTQVHSYEDDGNSYQNTIRHNPDGTSTVISAVTDPDGVTRTTEHNRSTMEGNIEEAPGVPERDQKIERATGVYPRGEDTRLGLPEDKPREPLEVVNTRQTITNAEGETRPVRESTTYSQATVPESSSGSYAPDGKVLPIEGNTEVSHQTSYSTTTTFDENGSPVTENSWSDKETYTGTGDQGQEVYSSHETRTTQRADGQIDGARIDESRGVYTRADLAGENDSSVSRLNDPATSLENYPDVLDRVAGNDDYVNVRTTQTEGSVNASVAEYGDYDNPDADGTSARVTYDFDKEPNRLVELRDVSNNGNNIDEQVFVPGTDRTMITRTRMEPDSLPPGSMTVENEIKDGDKLVQTSNNTIQVVDRAQVAPAELIPGVPAPGVSNPTNLANGEMVNSFLETADGQIVMNSQQVKNYDDNGENPTTTTATAYTAENGRELRIATGPEGTATALGAPDGTAQIHDPSGSLLQQTADGQLTLDGQAVEIPGYDAAQTGASAGSTLNNLAQAAAREENVLGADFSNSLDALGVAFSTFDAGQSLAQGDGWGALEALGGAATDWNSLGQALSKGGGGPRALQLARNVAKFAGPAAMGLNGLTAAHKFAEGDIEGGALAASSTVGTGLLLGASRLGAFAGPAGWTVMGLTSAYALADQAGMLEFLPWNEREIPDYQRIVPVQIG